jgi:preprotein translocase subunit SecA
LEKTLHEMWRKAAYGEQGTGDKKHWAVYMPLEQKIYEDMLASKQCRLTGALTDLAKQYNMKPEYVCGFLDGIKEAVNEELEPETVNEDYIVDISFEPERLFKKMVEYKAKHLYTLPQWDAYFDKETQDRMIDEQKSSGTYVRGEKPGRNDPCPCGSGKKYKKCCGALAG